VERVYWDGRNQDDDLITVLLWLAAAAAMTMKKMVITTTQRTGVLSTTQDRRLFGKNCPLRGSPIVVY
jgi:hypothetical protein